MPTSLVALQILLILLPGFASATVIDTTEIPGQGILLTKNSGIRSISLLKMQADGNDEQVKP